MISLFKKSTISLITYFSYVSEFIILLTIIKLNIHFIDFNSLFHLASINNIPFTNFNFSILLITIKYLPYYLSIIFTSFISCNFINQLIDTSSTYTFNFFPQNLKVFVNVYLLQHFPNFKQNFIICLIIVSFFVIQNFTFLIF